MNLEAGDTVDITETPEGLLVSAKAKHKKKEILFKFHTDLKSFTRSVLNSAYRLGYDVIRLHTLNTPQQYHVRKLVEKVLLGFAIVSKSGRDITIENTAEPSADKQQEIFRRLFLTIEESFSIIAKDFGANTFDNLEELEYLTKKHIQYSNFCRRNITKKRFSHENVCVYWASCNDLLLLQHSLLHLYETFLQVPFVEQSDHFAFLHSIFLQVQKNVFRNNLASISKHHLQLRKFLFERVHRDLRESNIDSVILYYYGEISRLMYVANTHFVELLVLEESDEYLLQH